jgi:hypothetical protein
MQAFVAARAFFAALASSRGETWDPRVGPRLPTLFADVGIEPLEVQLFPVSISRLGPPEAAIWAGRRHAVEVDVATTTDPAVRRAGDECLRALDEYKTAAASAGKGFVEIQSTLLFAVVGQRDE